jgi:uncharacterized LabA/DUF88 family protein
MERRRKRLNIYFDGFNFYYGCVKGTLHRWLDLGKLCRMTLPEHQIHRIRYFTARVKSWDDAGQPQRQLTYLRALLTIPNLSIHYGHFTVQKKWQRLVAPPPPPASHMARVWIPEEKGSDVNLATHLLIDRYEGDYDAAVIVSNDSDLLLPIEMIRARLNLEVGVINPYKDARPSLQQAADFYRTCSEGALNACHFPPVLQDAHGEITKPDSWSRSSAPLSIQERRRRRSDRSSFAYGRATAGGAATGRRRRRT